ncbi:portal protein [Sutterella wadsworthensis]|jgi:hypothetical protein|uniref:portal protein n=1 Tax=Sutterella wadsworthensis TaxID=40545 RepID=UPI0035620C61
MARVEPRKVFERFSQLKEERATWEPLWRDIRDFILPQAGVFEGEKSYEGWRRHRKIVDPTPIQYADMLSSGLYSGVSSPARPWLKLTTKDPKLDEEPDVRQWLDDVQKQMLLLFAKSEVYSALHKSYIELPVFGTACTICRRHPTDTIALQNLTIGEYWLADDAYGRIDTMYRRLSMTAKQIVDQWGIDAVSINVRSLYQTDPFHRVNVIHGIEPRFDRDEQRRDGLNKPWRSVYFEEGADKKVLSEAGFDEFPALCPRWMTYANSVYGHGPGSLALSFSKSLQRLGTREATLVDKSTNPAMVYPMTYTGQLDQLLQPGGLIPVGPNDAQLVRPAWDLRGLSVDSLEALIARRQQQLQSIFYVNIFQMIAASAGDQRTATEVAALQQEKSMMLGPVLERLHSEMLDPLVATAFGFMIEDDLLPPPPEMLQGQQLSVEYISVLAEAQRTADAQGITKTIQEIGLIAQMKPDVLDKLDADIAVDKISSMNGVPPSMIVAGKNLALIRQQRTQVQQQAAMQQQAMNQADVLKNLGQAVNSAGLQQAAVQGLL